MVYFLPKNDIFDYEIPFTLVFKYIFVKIFLLMTFIYIYISSKTSNILAQLLNDLYFKGALSGLRQFLAAESPLKSMKNTFYFTSKDLFVLKIFKFLSRIFGHAAKRLA